MVYKNSSFLSFQFHIISRAFCICILIIDVALPLPHTHRGLRSTTNTNLRHSQSHIDDFNNDVLNLADISCGQTPGFRHSRIIGGVDASPGEFPWSVSLQDLDGDGGGGRHHNHFCGGMVISNKHVLTAAHCFIHYFYGETSSIKSQRLVFGSNDLPLATRSLWPTQIRKIKSLVLHPGFTHFFPSFSNDIAIIELDRELKWSEMVQPICLPKKVEVDTDVKFKISVGVVAGWGSGSGSTGKRHSTQKLQKLVLPLWSNEKCQRSYTKGGISWETKSSHLCAGFAEGRRDTCKGDSGSALLTKTSTMGNNGERMQMAWAAVGLTSGGKGCALEGLPGIYTRVSYFVPWILNTLKSFKHS